jgi:oligopeptide/dipeptide ABC transporter ATP-binding protein
MSKRILLVDDDQDFVASVEEWLKANGYEVTVAFDGTSGIEKARQLKPDLMILDVMIRLRDEAGISFLYITHDLSTAYQVGDEIFVLYQGAIAEHGRTVDVIEQPKHPYVQMLISSVPVPDPKVKWTSELEGVADESLRASTESGCRFYPRCPKRMERCLVSQPPLYDSKGGEIGRAHV